MEDNFCLRNVHNKFIVCFNRYSQRKYILCDTIRDVLIFFKKVNAVDIQVTMYGDSYPVDNIYIKCK